MKWTTLLLLGLLPGITNATSLQPELDKIINQVDPNVNIGISVIDLTTGENLYQRNAERDFVPASNMKLFSNAAALLALGPDFRFTSALSTSAHTLQNGVLHGDVYLELPGDPALTQHHLQQLLQKLRELKIQQITGDFILVNPYKTASPYAPGIVKKDMTFSYGAPTSPFIMNENSLNITINPASHEKTLAIIEYDAPFIAIHNEIKTVSKPHNCGINLTLDTENNLYAKGCIAIDSQAAQHSIAILKPELYLQQFISYQLTQLGIKITGKVRTGTAPKQAILLTKHMSPPLHTLIKNTLKSSNNLYADRLYLQTASYLQGTPCDWSTAPTIIKNFLGKETNINFTKANFIDGSGLSRQDKVTPKQTIQLLIYMATRFPLAYEYIAALPISGEDGTLQNRLKKITQKGFVRAKTGTMTGIMSLSGYLATKNAHTIAFAIYINTLKGTKPAISGKYKNLIDTICDFLLQQTPTANNTLENIRTQVAYQQTSHKNIARVRAWRKLELAIKQALKPYPVNILYHSNDLQLIDNSANIQLVWQALQKVADKYSFSVTLYNSTPLISTTGPFLLWINSANTGKMQRVWTLRPV